MAANLVSEACGGSFLPELLHFAGWQVQVREGPRPTIHAARADIELKVSGTSLADAAGTTFAHAMPASRRRNRDEEV